MKNKLLHSFRLRATMLVAMMLCVVNAAWAQTTVTWSGTTALPGTATAVNGDGNVTIMISSTNTYNSPIRVYANTTITIQAATGYKIESVTYEASSTGNYVTNAENATVTPSVTPDVDGKYVTWSFTDGTSEFTFTPSTQTRANSISITYSSTGGGSTVPSITADNVEIEYNATSSSIDFTVNDGTQDGVLTAAITAGNEGSWLSLGTVTTSVPLTCSANEGNADRTATVTLTYTYNNDKTATKTVTVTQKREVLDYATLPFTFTSGNSAIEKTNGLTQSGLGTDYGDSNAPLKFDGTGDYLILKINERPGTLTFNIKNNSFSGGTFKLQTSEDGTDYTDHKSYTNISSTQNEEIDNLGENVRYIKWIYTEKDQGNVGLGNIVLAKYVAPGNSAPAWSELPTPTINAKEGEFEINLSDYVSGTPTPTITLSTSVSSDLYEFEDGLLMFVPSAAGTYEFTFTATNSEGSADATLTVTAEAVPFITANDVEIEHNATDGNIAFTLKNEVTGGLISASTTADWLTLGNETSSPISFTCSENEGNTDRTATVTLTYTYNTNETVTKNVTVTQSHFVVDYATLPFAWEGGASSDFLALSGVTASGLASDYASGNAPYYIKLDGTGDYIQVKTDGQPGKVTIGVKMIGGNTTSTITVQESADGETFTAVQALSISGDQNNVLTLETTKAFAATTRYVRLLFTKGSNVGVGPISIAPFTVTLNANGYATFASTSPVDFTDAETNGYTAWAVTGISGTEVTFTQIENAVEEGTGVFLKGTASSDVRPYYTATGTTVSGNKLVGITTATDVTAGEYFGLKGNEFVPVNAGTIPAGKALLPATEVPNEVKAFTFVFVNTATGVRTVETVSAEDAKAIFNLAGQRLSKTQRGINIVNGKKVVVK